MTRTFTTLHNYRLMIALSASLLAAIATAAYTHNHWSPVIQSLLSAKDDPSSGIDNSPGVGDDQQRPSHSHAGNHAANALELSDVAWKNIGLKTGVVQLQTFVKSVSMPAMVVERPGRTQVEITSPFTGTVMRIHPIEGEAVEPGQPLYELRLTHEDLVTAQRDFLRSAEELAVIEREITRLEAAGEGVIAGRRVLEQKYEKQKVEAALHAQRQGLLLHGLSREQIDEILKTRSLLQTLTVVAPPFPDNDDHREILHLFHVQKVNVRPGQHVAAGGALGMLADHCLLYVEGQAFEDDAARLVQAAREGWDIRVTRLSENADVNTVESLEVLYVADRIDPQTRALKFYLSLPNELIRDQADGNHRFVAWKYRPGERLEVRVPVSEPLEDQLVLPPEAVVEEGPEVFVFEQNGEHFDRTPVHIVYRDNDSVVIENDGSLVGSTLAMSGAYQMHLAIKNKSAGGVDPHHGHSH